MAYINSTSKQLEFILMKHYAPNRCEPSIEVIMKMWVQWGGRVFGGCQGGSDRERRIEVIVKIKKRIRGRGLGQGRCE